MNLGPAELIVIFVVALLVFGPDKLPEIGRQVGQVVREVRKFQSSLQNEFRDVIDEPPPRPAVPPTRPLSGSDPTPSGPAVSPPPVAGDQPADGGDGGGPGEIEPHSPSPE